MVPSSSDNFVISDFDDTFTTLDNTPGITPVANYAGISTLAGTLTSAQDGSVFLQKDNGCLWQWIKPGAPAGSFKKMTSVGLIKVANQTAAISTSTTVLGSAPTIVTTTFVYPGNRWVFLFFSHPNISNSGSFGYSQVDMWIGAGVAEYSLMSGGAPNKSISHRLIQGIAPGTGTPAADPGATITIKVTCRSTAYGGGTTTAPVAGQLYIFEL